MNTLNLPVVYNESVEFRNYLASSVPEDTSVSVMACSHNENEQIFEFTVEVFPSNLEKDWENYEQAANALVDATKKFEASNDSLTGPFFSKIVEDEQDGHYKCMMFWRIQEDLLDTDNTTKKPVASVCPSLFLDRIQEVLDLKQNLEQSYPIESVNMHFSKDFPGSHLTAHFEIRYPRGWFKMQYPNKKFNGDEDIQEYLIIDDYVERLNQELGYKASREYEFGSVQATDEINLLIEWSDHDSK